MIVREEIFVRDSSRIILMSPEVDLVSHCTADTEYPTHRRKEREMKGLKH